MPPEFQKTMDKILHNIRTTFTFNDDILIVAEGNEENHMKKVEELRTMAEAEIHLNLEKCKFAQTSTERLGFTL